MATFKQQVEGLTGLSLTTDSSPTLDELSQFLVDGTADVVNKSIELSPKELSKFTTTTNSTSTVAKRGRVLAVYREHDSTSILRPASRIAPELKYEATDTESLHYRSKFNPGYYEKDGNIECVPTPNDSSNNDLVVTQVYYAVNTGHSSSSIDNFPDEKEYLVVLYAGAQSLLASMAQLDNELPEDIIIPPTPEVPTMAEKSVSITGTAPTYTKSAIAPDFADAEHWLNTEEDAEMVQARVGIIQSEIGVYQSRVQEELNEFNKESAEYQAKLQKDLQDAQLAEAKEARDLELYIAEIQAYQAKVGAEVQNYASRLQKHVANYEWMQGRYVALKQQYDQAFMMLAPKKEKTKQGAR